MLTKQMDIPRGDDPKPPRTVTWLDHSPRFLGAKPGGTLLCSVLTSITTGDLGQCGWATSNQAKVPKAGMTFC